MSNLTQLRLAAREIFEAALRAVDAGEALRQSVRLEGFRLLIGDVFFDIRERSVYSVAIGKAALPMAAALEEVVGEKLAAGVIAGPALPQSRTKTARKLGHRWQRFEGGHPLPTEASLLAANAAFDLLELANKENGLVVFLVSGGGSAMIESPISEDITLEDLQNANRILVNSGASIAEINSVRRAFSAIKGEQLAARAPNCDQITLIVSDVPAGEERYVASGPSLAPEADAPSALEVIDRFNLRRHLPSAVIRAIDEPQPVAAQESGQPQYVVLLDNGDAIEAAASAAHQLGFTVEIARDISDQPICDGCEDLLKRLDRAHATAGEMAGAGFCLISGGEFACPVRGGGMGGRNLESALRLACSTNSSLSDIGHFVALCAGTDGIDGNSPAAGAIVDHTTIERATRIGLNPLDFLNRSDAYSFFVALGDVIATGPTGTNVRDLRILLRSS